MEAKDTVMSDKQIVKINSDTPSSSFDPQMSDTRRLVACKMVAKAQAEISFKVGCELHEKEFEEGLNDMAILAQRRYRDGKKAGIKKLGDWLKSRGCGTSDCDMEYGELEAQLQEWGIGGKK